MRTSTACTANLDTKNLLTSRRLCAATWPIPERPACAETACSGSGSVELAMDSQMVYFITLLAQGQHCVLQGGQCGRRRRAGAVVAASNFWSWRNFSTKPLPYLQRQRGVREGGQRGRRRGAGAAVAQAGRRVLHHHTAPARPHLLHQRVLHISFFGSVYQNSLFAQVPPLRMFCGTCPTSSSPSGWHLFLDVLVDDSE